MTYENGQCVETVNIYNSSGTSINRMRHTNQTKEYCCLDGIKNYNGPIDLDIDNTIILAYDPYNTHTDDTQWYNVLDDSEAPTNKLEANFAEFNLDV